jgi:TonB family protein
MLKWCLVAVAFLTLLSVSSRAQEVYEPGNGVSLPAAIKEVHLMGDTDATVGIACVVMTDGTVGTAIVTNSPDTKLNDVAIRALRQWRFTPGMKAGQPVAVRIFVALTIEHS